jgi:hypothetical protein
VEPSNAFPLPPPPLQSLHHHSFKMAGRIPMMNVRLPFTLYSFHRSSPLCPRRLCSLTPLLSLQQQNPTVLVLKEGTDTSQGTLHTFSTRRQSSSVPLVLATERE